MGYFDTEKNVGEYLRMVEGYDGAELIAEFTAKVPKGSRVLELGMGGGTDLDLLREAGFDATGSDASEVFLDHYRKRGGKSPTLRLDARTIEIELRFDAIFSNKVLQHLTPVEMRSSFERQAEVLPAGGLLFHSLWHGDESEQHHGLLFNKYTRRTFAAVLPDDLEIAEFVTYDEMAKDDSFWVLLRRRQPS